MLYYVPTLLFSVLLSLSSNHAGRQALAKFYLESVSVTGAKGAMRLEGRQAQTHFTKESDDYVLTYE